MSTLFITDKSGTKKVKILNLGLNFSVKNNEIEYINWVYTVMDLRNKKFEIIQIGI
jgi:hypothetical protein